MKKKLIFLITLIFFSIFLSFFNQSNVQYYNDLLVFFNDPLGNIPQLALKYVSSSLTQYFNAKGIKIYTEYPVSLEAAFKLAKEKDLSFLLEIKGNLTSFSRGSSGYSVKIDVAASMFILNDPVAKFNSFDGGISENALSADIAFAYALYDGSLKAIEKIIKDILVLLKK